VLLTTLVFIIIISILVFVHEFGHFLVAKKAGMKIEEFGFGYPPRVWGKRVGETIYSINALPIGGFVKILGEELGEEVAKEDEKKTFYSQSKKARTAVLLAGVLMNFLLAVIAFSIIYTQIGIPTKTDWVSIVGVTENSPAALAGIKEEDIVVKVDGQEIKDNDSFIRLTNEKAGEKMIIEIRRKKDNPCQEKVLGGVPGMEISCQNGNLLISVVPRENPPEGEGALGVVISQMEMKFYPFWQMPIRGSVEGFKEAFAWIRLVLEFVVGMVGRLFAGELPRDVAGPVGIFQITGQAVEGGWLAILQFLGILSVNLMVLNILPFPALDGGRLVFIGYEAVTGRRPKPSIERWINTFGMVALLLLLFLVTVNDVARIINTSNLLNRLAPLRDLLPF
jgi:regulator of sigma E protease